VLRKISPQGKTKIGTSATAFMIFGGTLKKINAKSIVTKSALPFLLKSILMNVTVNLASSGIHKLINARETVEPMVMRMDFRMVLFLIVSARMDIPGSTIYKNATKTVEMSLMQKVEEDPHLILATAKLSLIGTMVSANMNVSAQSMINRQMMESVLVKAMPFGMRTMIGVKLTAVRIL
jgi:hypothetical protein